MRSFSFSRMRPPIVGIEIGSSKTCCWIGKRTGEGEISLVGSGHAATQGLFGNKLLDMEKLEKTLSRVVYEAEKEAGLQIRQAIVTLGGAFFRSEVHTVTHTLAQETLISQNDVRALIRRLPLGLFPIHLIPLEFKVDGQGEILNPRGMMGQKLEGSFHVIGLSRQKLHALISCLKRCQITLSSVLCSGYGGALACLMPDEKILGVTLVDFGASGTSCTSFFHNQWVDFQWIPLGGSHITQDIAQGCDTALLHAERIKILYGAAIPSQNDYHELIPLVPLGERGKTITTQMTRSFLINVIRARVQEILTRLKPRLEVLGKRYPFAIQRLVFTGGGSQLPGLREAAQQILPGTIRLSKPIFVKNAPHVSPGFSTITGTLLYPDSPLYGQEKLLLNAEDFPKKRRFWGLF